MVWRWLWKDSGLEPMRCEMTSSVKECALRARSTNGVHHAIVKVNIVIGVVPGEVLVARVPLVVVAVIGLTHSLIAHVVIVVFVVIILHRIFLYGRYTLYMFLVHRIHRREEYRLSFPQILSSRYQSWICDGVWTDCTSDVTNVLEEIVRN